MKLMLNQETIIEDIAFNHKRPSRKELLETKKELLSRRYKIFTMKLHLPKGINEIKADPHSHSIEAVGRTGGINPSDKADHFHDISGVLAKVSAVPNLKKLSK